MRAGSLEILAITALFVNYVAGDAESQTKAETKIKISTSGSKGNVSVPSLKTAVSSPKNADTAKILPRTHDYWMTKIGSMQNDLINVQAIIVKDEKTKVTCGIADRKSNTRYLMCAGSILNRNHVLTSATCLHDSTHIRHNIRAPLAVVIAPLKPSIQVIAVTDYQVHPHHNKNPYSKEHLKHNVAILKLACRISIENNHKIELPRTPMMQTCSDEDCVVAIYIKTGRTNNAMLQILAPNMPYSNRRRKATSVKDVGLQRSRDYENSEMIDAAIRLQRAKRKLAEPPIFIRKYVSGKRFNVSSNSTSESTTENSTAEPKSTIPSGGKNRSSTTEANLYDDVSKALKGPGVGNETVKSFVVRSSHKPRHSCAKTGAPIMLNKTQAALVAIPCSDRQPLIEWRYTDLFENLDWILAILRDWDPSPANSHWPHPADEAKPPGTSGNHSGCSTCIFNFFIEIGCKDKNQCGKNLTVPHEGLPPSVQNQLKPENNVIAEQRRNQGCSGGTSVGIELGIGQRCDKTDKESGSRPEYRSKSSKPIVEAEKQKHLPLPNVAVDDAAQLEQPVTNGPVKTAVRDYTVNKDKYPSKDNSRGSAISQTYKTPISVNSHRERITNEIGLQNIEGDSADWVSEVEKGLELNSEVKRESVMSRRSNIK